LTVSHWKGHLAAVAPIDGARRRVGAEFMPDSDALQAALDVDVANVAVLDANGRIVSVNRSWKKFAAARGLRGPDFGVGLHYCERAGGTASQ